MKMCFTFLFVCVFVHMHAHMLSNVGYLQRPEEGARSSGAGVIGGYKSPGVFWELYSSLPLEPQALNLLAISPAHSTFCCFVSTALFELLVPVSLTQGWGEVTLVSGRFPLSRYQT